MEKMGDTRAGRAIERELERRCDGQWPELIRILREARND